jgi:prevent-host-death family protein
MRYSTQIRPISYLKANAAEILNNMGEFKEPMIITQNGEAKAVLQSIVAYEQTQETLALLKLLALGDRDIKNGRTKPIRDVINRIKTKPISE